MADPIKDPPVISDEVKAHISGLTADQVKEAFPKLYDSLGASLKPKVPEKFAVKLPEKATLSAEVLDRTTTAARELGLTSDEQAQRLVDFTNGEAQAVAERIAKDYSPGGSIFESQRQKYTEEALKASDIGEGKPEVLQARVALATTFTNKYFPEAVRKAINDTGIGNHPDFLRAILKIGEALKEDGFVTGAASRPKKTTAQRIYSKATS